MTNRHTILAITGASGAVYGVRLAEELLRAGGRLTLLISRAGCAVLREECGLDWGGEVSEVRQRIRGYFFSALEVKGKGYSGGKNGKKTPQVEYHSVDDFLAPFASGSSASDAMVICPCTMGTAGRIAAGFSRNLIERSADVMLKEHRPLLLVPRETPFNAIHLENLLKLSRAGARIIPAMPAFYHRPASLEELVNFMVGKVLDQLGVEHSLFPRWGKEA